MSQTADGAAALSDRFRALEDEIRQLREDIRVERDAASPLIEILLRDNAARRTAETELAEAQTWIQVAQEHGGVAAYNFDIQSGDLVWSASTFALYGWTPSEQRPSLETWLAAIHPEDRAVAQAVAAAAIAHGREVTHEFRVVLPDGRIRWISDRGKVLLNAKGEPQRIVGLNVDVTSLKAVQAALADSEDQFRFTFENIEVGIAHVDIEGRFLKVNRCLCDLLGYEADELRDMTFQQITHPEDLDADLELVGKLIRGEVRTYSMEKRYIAKSGELVWACLTVALRRTEAGEPVNFISCIFDIRERRSVEERLSFLFEELAHRSKNLLSVVQSVVRQTAKSATSVAELEAAVCRRLIGLAESQDMMTRHSEDGADLLDLVRRHLRAFISPDDPRVTICGTPARLRADAVRTVGMALHELATNACKYGSLSIPSGRLAVEWACPADGDPGDLTMTWTESDGPPVEPPQRNGFGSRVISGVVRSSLGAEVSLDFPPEGVRWRMHAPAVLYTEPN